MKWTLLKIHQDQRRLLRRHRATRDRGFITIGFGAALKESKKDFNRRVVFHYLVRAKKDSDKMASKYRVPKHIVVYERLRGRRRRRLIPTDVIAVGTMKLQAADIVGDNNQFTAGYVVSWVDSGTRFFGLLSVGHGFISVNPTASISNDGVSRTSQRIKYTKLGNKYDVSLITMTIDDLRALRPGFATNPQPIDYPTTEQLTATDTSNPQCLLYTVPSIGLFHLVSYLTPGEPLANQFPALTNLFLGSATGSIFVDGTSGSPWILNKDTPVPAAMQIGGSASDGKLGLKQANV